MSAGMYIFRKTLMRIAEAMGCELCIHYFNDSDLIEITIRDVNKLDGYTFESRVTTAYLKRTDIPGNTDKAIEYAHDVFNILINKLGKEEYNNMFANEKVLTNNPEIENVIFNPPATIVFWTDGSKTVVKAQNGEFFDPEKGLAMAIAKKHFGNKGHYFEEIKKWTEKYAAKKTVMEPIKKCKFTCEGVKINCDILNMMFDNLTFTPKTNPEGTDA